MGPWKRKCLTGFKELIKLMFCMYGMNEIKESQNQEIENIESWGSWEFSKGMKSCKNFIPDGGNFYKTGKRE